MARSWHYKDCQVNRWQQDYPVLWAQFDACRSRKALNKLVREQKKLMDQWGVLDAFRDAVRDEVDCREAADIKAAADQEREAARRDRIAAAPPTIVRAELLTYLQDRLAQTVEGGREAANRRDNEYERAWNSAQHFLYASLISRIEEALPLV